MKNSYSQKIQQPMTNKNMWSRFLLKMFTLSSSAVNSAAVNSVIVTSARLLTVVNDISWFVKRNWRRQWGVSKFTVCNQLRDQTKDLTFKL